MTGLVERHGEVRPRPRYRPGGDHSALSTVHHGDMPGGGDVHEDAPATRFQLECFRMPGEPNGSELLRAASIHKSERAVAVPNDDLVRLRIVPHVVGVAGEG